MKLTCTPASAEIWVLVLDIPAFVAHFGQRFPAVAVPVPLDATRAAVVSSGVTRDELRQLRKEAAAFLADLQALPGFSDRRADLPPVPESCAELPYWSIRALARGARGAYATGRLRWRYWSDSDDSLPPDPKSAKQLERLRDMGYPVDVLQQDGSTLTRMPEDVPVPVTKERDAIEHYREPVGNFATRFLLAAQWAPNAVHDALRRDELIVLPAAPGDGFVVPPLVDRFTLDPGQPVPREDLRRLGEALLSASEDTGEPELGPGRDRTWAGALDAVRSELGGRRLTSTERGNRLRARRLLDGAVNGRLNSEPVDWAHDQGLLERAPGDGGDGND